MMRRSCTSFPNVVKSAAQISRTLNLQRINCCTFARLLPNRIYECKPQSSLLPARFLSCGLCQHTHCCALRHERQANAALTRADQQFCAAWADQEGISLTQIHRTVRGTVAITAHKRQAERHIARPVRNGLNRPEAAPYLIKVVTVFICLLQIDRTARLILKIEAQRKIGIAAGFTYHSFCDPAHSRAL